MFKFLEKIFGSPSERALKKIKPYLEKIYVEHKTLKLLSDQELRYTSTQLKKNLTNTLKPIQDKITALQQKAENTQDLKNKIKYYHQVDNLQLTYDQAQEKHLIEILPRAFAIMKETAYRFATQENLILPTTEYDEAMAKKYAHVTIKNNKAHWHTTWESGGEQKKWDMIPYDVQLLGAIVLHQGKIAEMKTGEGKTLASTLPIFLNALTGRGVHIITVNDYLARRDAAWMGPLYQFHQLTVDCVDQHQPFSDARKKAYQADITYCTGNAVGFDYLRDNMATSLKSKVQRGHNYAIVDEVDSVLIDDARTPLIISGEASYIGHQEYYSLKPLIQQLYLTQNQLVAQLLQEAKEKIAHGDKKEKEEGALALFRTYRALPKYKPLIQFLSQKGIKQLLSTTEDHYIQENARLMPEADEILFFTIDSKLNHINLTEKGINYLSEKIQQPNFFILPNIAVKIGTIENDPNLKDEEKIKQKEQLTKDYSIKSARLHAVNQLLKAYATFEKEVDYVVMHQEVKIVDEKTGRILQGRRYSNGLHQALEAKENVKIEAPTQTYATITPQNQFRMYRKLSGMTGTAETEASEFWEIYKLEVVVIPTNKPVIRKDHDILVFKTKAEKLKAIKKATETLQKEKRPVLVNTTSVEASEEMRKLLGLKKNEVLNARNHAIESKIIANAGQAGKITVVTQMGGRGTDIKLSPEAKKAGGLAVLLSELNESQRVDNQTIGRSGRQGDPGSSQPFVSLEDRGIAHYKHSTMGKYMDKAFYEEDEAIQDPWITSALRRSQEQREEQHFFSRKRSLEYDDVMNMQRVVIYGKRNHALQGNRLSLDIMSLFYNTIANMVEEAKNRQSPQHLQLDLKATLGLSLTITHEKLSKQSLEKLVETLYQKALQHYEERKKKFMEKLVTMLEKIPPQTKITHFSLPTTHEKEEISATIHCHSTIETKGKTAIKSIESAIILHFLDEYWKRHLLQMDQLRETTRNAVYEQKDPLLIYKFEALELFKQLMRNINKSTVTYLTQWHLPHDEIDTKKNLETSKDPFQGLEAHKAQSGIDSIIPVNPQPVHRKKIANRNQRVTVQYTNGTIKKNVKYKTVESDINEGNCEIINV